MNISTSLRSASRERKVKLLGHLADLARRINFPTIVNPAAVISLTVSVVRPRFSSKCDTARSLSAAAGGMLAVGVDCQRAESCNG